MDKNFKSVKADFVSDDDITKAYYVSICPYCEMENKSYHDNKGYVLWFPQEHNCIHYRGVYQNAVDHKYSAFYSPYGSV